MNKKVISSVLAGAMAISTLGVVASAATVESKQTYNAKADLMETAINANVPTDLEAKINPYGAAVVKTASTVEVAKGYSDGIVSPTYAISNLDTNAGLKVSATAKITGSSTVTLMTKPMLEDKLEKATEKQVFAFLNTTTNATGEFTGTGTAATTGTVQPVFIDTKYVGNDAQLAFTEDGAVKSGIMEIAALATGTDPKAASSGFFYVGGQCTPNPETPWDNKDTVTIDLILDLSPSMGKPADLTLASVELKTGTAYKDFDAAITSYDIIAKGSVTNAANIKVTAKSEKSFVYVVFNGKMVDASASAVTAAKGQIGVTKYGDGTTAGTVTVTPATDGTSAIDYKVGDKLQFVVVDAKTFESATYTFNFVE